MRYSVFMKRRILLIEDDRLLAETLEDLLEEYELITAQDGLEALELHFQNSFDLYLIDINLPKLKGSDFLEHLRQKGDTVPAIFLTSNTNIETIKHCFKIGADDYIKKPFDIEELLCRIEAVLRRYYGNKPHFVLSKECIYDFHLRQLICNNKAIYLPPKVIKLLELLIRNANRCTCNEEIMETLWHPSQECSIGAIRIYINMIRKYIGKERVKNIKGNGYILLTDT